MDGEIRLDNDFNQGTVCEEHIGFVWSQYDGGTIIHVSFQLSHLNLHKKILKEFVILFVKKGNWHLQAGLPITVA